MTPPPCSQQQALTPGPSQLQPAVAPAPSQLPGVTLVPLPQQPAVTPAPSAMLLPPSQQLTPFLDMRGWIKDAVEQAVQPLITEITILKGKLEETDNRVRKLEKEVMGAER